ncbi:MAG: response regulator [Nitrospirae bacterium]|nr:response regulator [Nitrospirota bacterium]MBF0533717.1 response regulator [Nitrospirota bacterium]MBF0615574.1 response regulator [Nitrospirota bacterium]
MVKLTAKAAIKYNLISVEIIMLDYNQLFEIKKGLTVLYVDDEAAPWLIRKLMRIFKDVIVAEDGMKALMKFNQNHIDLILTDYMMPELNGLDLIRKIRKVNQRIPIILITGYVDTDFLIESINLGVTQFVIKPIQMPALIDAIEMAVSQYVVEDIVQKNQAQELEILRYKEKYHSAQQEMAFLKELKIIKNDLSHRTIESPDRSLWFAGVCYVPLDILSGDSYSIREVSTQKYLFCISDAMGKGLSASVTTILTTSFINHMIDQSKQSGNFDFKDFVVNYTEFIKKELLSEEILCAAFVFFDFQNETMDYAIYSMPPVLIEASDGSLLKLRCNNLPIMRYINSHVINSCSLKDITKILIYSDGLNECRTINKNGIYQEELEDDFLNSAFKDDLYEKFKAATEVSEDDITFILLQRFNCPNKNQKTFVIESRIEQVNYLGCEVEKYLASIGLNEEQNVATISSFNELLINAYEHGSLDIKSSKKDEMVKKGEYEDFMLEKEKLVDKKITVTINTIKHQIRDFLVIKIEDEGLGFDVSKLNDANPDNKQFSGRGIRIAKTLSNNVLYNERGTIAVLINAIG